MSTARALPVVHSNPHGDRFARRTEGSLGGPLRAGAVEILQLNLGKVCNQACKHCHVDAGPNRTESMDLATAEACIDALARNKIATLDITGGAPEMNPHFRMLVERARALGAKVMVRHNLTVMFEPGQRDLPGFFAANEVEVISSLPHYFEEATDRQRGKGVFAESIDAMRLLNEAGYGTGRADRSFSLVYNPVGAFLPGSQADLERDYKRELQGKHGVTFDRLLALTNMPISRFKDWLRKTGQLEDYQSALEAAYNPATVPGLMCKSTVSVSWDGFLYDCDFNQMLSLGVEGAPATVAGFDVQKLAGRAIATGDHCFGCTAGAGSSCGGTLT